MFFLVMLFACSLLIDDAVQLGEHESSFNQFTMARNRLDEDLCEIYCKCPDGPVLRGKDEESPVSGQLLGNPGHSKRTETTLDAIYYDYPSPLTSIRRIFV